MIEIKEQHWNESIYIPDVEMSYYKNMRNLSSKDKKLLWEMMKGASKDGIYIFNGDQSEIKELVRLRLVVINTSYRPLNNNISLIVLPYAPHLLRKLLKVKIKR